MPSNTDHQNYVVTGKDQEKNQLIVAFDRREEPSLWANEFHLQDVTFLDESYENSSNLKLLGKARYRDPSTPSSSTVLILKKFAQFLSQNLNAHLHPVRFWQYTTAKDWWDLESTHIQAWDEPAFA